MVGSCVDQYFSFFSTHPSLLLCAQVDPILSGYIKDLQSQHDGQDIYLGNSTSTSSSDDDEDDDGMCGDAMPSGISTPGSIVQGATLCEVGGSDALPESFPVAAPVDQKAPVSAACDGGGGLHPGPPGPTAPPTPPTKPCARPPLQQPPARRARAGRLRSAAASCNGNSSSTPLPRPLSPADNSTAAAAAAAPPLPGVVPSTELGCPTSHCCKSPLLPPQSDAMRGRMTVVLDLDGTLISSYSPNRAPLLGSADLVSYVVGRGSQLNPDGVLVVRQVGLKEFQGLWGGLVTLLLPGSFTRGKGAVQPYLGKLFILITGCTAAGLHFWMEKVSCSVLAQLNGQKGGGWGGVGKGMR